MNDQAKHRKNARYSLKMTRQQLKDLCQITQEIYPPFNVDTGAGHLYDVLWREVEEKLHLANVRGKDHASFRLSYPHAMVLLLVAQTSILQLDLAGDDPRIELSLLHTIQTLQRKLPCAVEKIPLIHA